MFTATSTSWTAMTSALRTARAKNAEPATGSPSMNRTTCASTSPTCDVCISGERDCVVGASCNLNGFCHGHVLSYNVTSSLTACLESCQALPACAWYSYHTDNYFCLLTSDCVTFDESCTNCISGERACFGGEPLTTTTSSSSTTTSYSSTESSTTPFVPNPFNRLIITKTGQVINLADDNKRCPNLTMSFYYSHGIYLNGKLVVCDKRNSSCFSMTSYGEDWQFIGDSFQARVNPGDVQLSDTKWWITGGMLFNEVDKPISSNTVIYDDNIGFKNYTNLPTKRWRHNVVNINSTHFMLTGGECYDGADCQSVWMFNQATDQWTPLQDFGGESWTYAGLVTYPSGQTAVVVAGGFSSSKSFIFNLDTETWRRGPELPATLYGGASVQLQETFLVVSGVEGGINLSKSIFKFVTSPEEGWIELPQQLWSGLTNCDAILVPQDFVECYL